jgi:hypothetical protein
MVYQPWGVPLQLVYTLSSIYTILFQELLACQKEINFNMYILLF